MRICLQCLNATFFFSCLTARPCPAQQNIQCSLIIISPRKVNWIHSRQLTFWLTCDGECSVAWSNGKTWTVRVASHTPIDSSVAFFPAVDNAEEEQIASWQHDTMVVVAALVASGADDKFAVAVPFNDGSRRSINRALESYWVVFCHRHVGRMFRNSQSTNTCWKNERKKDKKWQLFAHVDQVCFDITRMFS